jgi:hypothetical protein
MRRTCCAVGLAVLTAVVAASAAWAQPKVVAPPAVPPPGEGEPAAVVPAGDVSIPALPAPQAAPPAAERVKPPPIVIEERGRKPAPAAPADGPPPRQEAAVTLEWVGPGSARTGQPVDYNLVVQNTSSIPVQEVMVRARVPKELSVAAAEPKAVVEDNVLMWELGVLTPKQSKTLQLRFVAAAEGDLTPQAWVTFTGTAFARFRVREPRLEVKVGAPEKLTAGEDAVLNVTVSNAGQAAADVVKVEATLSEGLESSRGRKAEFELRGLQPGESRTLRFPCAARAGGAQYVEAVAEADSGARVQARATVNVSMPRLTVEVSGPGLRCLERRAPYTLKVTNTGDLPATEVTVQDVVPEGFKVLAADGGGRYHAPTRTVSWALGEIPPGQSREVRMEALAVAPGEHRHQVTAQAAPGLRAAAEFVTRVEGMSALLVQVAESDDPVEAGGETTYEVRVTNSGSKPETGVKLVCSVPAKMELKSAAGPAAHKVEGKDVVFEALPRLDPKSDAVYRVHVKAAAPELARFKVQLTSAEVVEPLVVMEATRVYGDAPRTGPEVTEQGSR